MVKDFDYTKKERAEFNKLKRLLKGTPIKWDINKYSGKIQLSGGGFEPIWTQFFSTTGNTLVIAKARKEVLKKLKQAKSKTVKK